MRILLLTSILLWSFVSSAHSHLLPSADVAPRSNNPGVKVGPCGGYPKVAVQPTLMPGQKITVTWEETIDHPGRYDFYFSQANDQSFVLLASIPDTQTGTPVPHEYSAQLTLPNVQCTGCTLQMIQVMTENPAMPSYYYSCADMKLDASATPTPTPSPTATPSATPIPVPTSAPVDCN